jgi:hypothetical protein
MLGLRLTSKSSFEDVNWNNLHCVQIRCTVPLLCARLDMLHAHTNYTTQDTLLSLYHT